MGKKRSILAFSIYFVFLAAVFIMIFMVPRSTVCEPETEVSNDTLLLVAESTDSISIVFAGDLMQHLPQINAALTDSGKYCFKDCFEHIAPIFNESGLVVVNLETTLSDLPPYSGYPSFRAPSQLARDMSGAGIDVALLANNHICDYGGKGIKNTASALDSAGILHTGVFVDSSSYSKLNPLVIERGGFRIAILNYTYGTNGIKTPSGMIVNRIDTAAMARDLLRLESDPRCITFVCLHWGNEYNTSPSVEQEKLAQWLRSKGVDFIIGGHPHVIQPLRTHRDSTGAINGVTAFSLGNFVSNQRLSNTDGGMVLRLTFARQGSGPVKMARAENFYAWTLRAIENSKTKYRIIPSFMADSLLRDDSTALKRYDEFIANARKITGKDNGFVEIKPDKPSVIKEISLTADSIGVRKL